MCIRDRSLIAWEGSGVERGPVPQVSIKVTSGAGKGTGVAFDAISGLTEMNVEDAKRARIE